jgi:putative FmdB family regulatory protein
MPTYTYRCKDCDTVFQDCILMNDRNKPTKCECGGEANRDVDAELATMRNVKVAADTGHWSMAMGVPPGQVAEFRKRFPNSTYNDKGDVWVGNLRDKRRQQKERGMVSHNDYY